MLSCLGVVYGVVHCLVIFSGDRADGQPKNESMDGQSSRRRKQSEREKDRGEECNRAAFTVAEKDLSSPWNGNSSNLLFAF